MRKALAWVKSLDKRNPERATIWGLVEVYLDAKMPDAALQLLEQRYVPPTMGERMRRVFQSGPNDDELRNDRLRFQALLQKGVQWDKELDALYNQLRQWAPRLLDGEMLMSFYIDGLLRPLLAAGRIDLVWSLLPQVRDALNASSGDKHAAQVQRVTMLLANQAAPGLDSDFAEDGFAEEDFAEERLADEGTTNGMTPVVPAAAAKTNGGTLYSPYTDPLQAHAELTNFLVQLWEEDVRKGLWQTIHGIEGSLALLLALDGAGALMTLAQVALREGGKWVKPWQPKEKEAIPRGIAVG